MQTSTRNLVLAISLTVLPVAHAQIGNPAFMAPDTVFEEGGVPAPQQSNTADVLFSRLLTEGGLAEIELGELAGDMASTPSVQDFASRMISDHSDANETLAGLAAGNDIPLPEELNPHHMDVRARLESADSERFDLDYIRAQVVEHQKAVSLLVWEIASGQDAELQQFAAATLPTVLAHLEQAKAIMAELASGDAGAAERLRP